MALSHVTNDFVFHDACQIALSNVAKVARSHQVANLGFFFTGSESDGNLPSKRSVNVAKDVPIFHCLLGPVLNSQPVAC